MQLGSCFELPFFLSRRDVHGIEIRIGAPDVDDSIAEQMDEFAACIQGGGRPEVAGEEGMAAVAVIEAIVRSAEGADPMPFRQSGAMTPSAPPRRNGNPTGRGSSFGRVAPSTT